MSGLRFGDEVSIQIARRVAGLLDHLAIEGTEVNTEPCPTCEGDGDCAHCGAECERCDGTGFVDARPKSRAEIIANLQSMSAVQFADLCRAHEYQHDGLVGCAFANGRAIEEPAAA